MAADCLAVRAKLPRFLQAVFVDLPINHHLYYPFEFVIPRSQAVHFLIQDHSQVRAGITEARDTRVGVPSTMRVVMYQTGGRFRMVQGLVVDQDSIELPSSVGKASGIETLASGYDGRETIPGNSVGGVLQAAGSGVWTLCIWPPLANSQADIRVGRKEMYGGTSRRFLCRITYQTILEWYVISSKVQ